VVGMLVGQQHGVGTGKRPWLAPYAGIDDQDPAVPFDPHTRVGPPRQPHPYDATAPRQQSDRSEIGLRAH